MREHARELVASAARDLAGKVHTEDDLHAVLFQLALDIVSPVGSRDEAHVLRRLPGANEVLPPHQRASWARAKTVYDRT